MLDKVKRFLFKQQPVSKAVSSATVAGLIDGFDTDAALNTLERNDYLYQAMLDNGISPDKLKFLLDDDEIGGAWGKRTLAVERRTFSLSDTESEAGLFVYEQMRKWYKPLAAEFLNAVLQGLSCPEIVYKQDSMGRYVISHIIQHETTRFLVDKAGRTYIKDKRYKDVLIADDDVLKHKFYPVIYRRTKARPAGTPLLVSLVWPWFLHSKVWQFWARYLERFASPQWVGKAASGYDLTTGKSNAQSMAEMLTKAIASGVVVVGADEDAQAVDASGSGGASFDTADNKLKARIQKRILGQTLTTELGSTGSYAAASVHKDVSDEIAADDIALITPALQSVVNSLLAINYPSAEPIEFNVDHDANLNESRAKRDLDLYAQGVRFTPDYYTNHYDLEPTDFVINDSAPTPQGQFKALPIRHYQFANTDDAWQELDNLADDAIKQAGDAVDVEALKGIVAASKNAGDLAERLAKYYDKTAPQHQFSETLAAMLFAADIMGYEQADKGLE